MTVLHLTRHEFYQMNPGLFYDMVQIHNNRIPGSKDDID